MFKSSDYVLSYDDFFPFDLHHAADAPIAFIKRNKQALVYASNNYVTLRTENKEKQLRFDSQVSSLDTSTKLILAGDNNGIIKLFDYKKKLLGTFDESQDRINDIKFIGSHQFVSASNDKTIRIFDIGNKDSIKCFKDHTDFVNCLYANQDYIFTGSFDRKVNVYDLKTYALIHQYNFDNKISKICLLDENNLIITEKYKIHKIDLRNDKLVESAFSHIREVSSLTSYKNMIYSTSHDGTLRTFSPHLKKQSQIKFNDKILCCDVTEDNIYIGLNNGNIFSFIKADDIKKEKKVAKPVMPMRYYSDPKDIKIKKFKYDSVTKNEYEKLINNNQHWLAFSKILNEKDADLVYGVLSYIMQQNGFKKVLIERSEEDIKILIDFVIDNFYIYDFRHVILIILNIMLDNYTRYFVNNNELKEKLFFLSELIDEEIIFQEEAINLSSVSEAFLLNKK